MLHLTIFEQKVVIRYLINYLINKLTATPVKGYDEGEKNLLKRTDAYCETFGEYR